MSKKEEIIKKAFEILALPEFKKGIRVMTLIKKVSTETGENINTCSGNLWDLYKKLPDKVSRPYRGLFILKENEKLLENTVEESPEQKADDKFSEEAIYEPAKIYLQDKEEACTHAVIVGGNAFGNKWGTPDIVGVIRADSDAVYKPILEIIAVEIKNEGYPPVVALGQAMAYKLFAHRTWLVLPDNADIDRILGIAITANIGLVSFTRNDKEFEFMTLNRPTSGRPDLTEVNIMIEKLKKDKQKYNELIKNERC